MNRNASLRNHNRRVKKKQKVNTRPQTSRKLPIVLAYGFPDEVQGSSDSIRGLEFKVKFFSESSEDDFMQTVTNNGYAHIFYCESASCLGGSGSDFQELLGNNKYLTFLPSNITYRELVSGASSAELRQ